MKSLSTDSVQLVGVDGVDSQTLIKFCGEAVFIMPMLYVVCRVYFVVL